MKKYFIFIFFFLSVITNAQAPQRFYTRFGGYGHDIGYGVLQTYKGQYAVCGSTGSFGNGNSDVYLALVDTMGWVRWEKSYGGFNNDVGRSIIQLPDSGFVIAGYSNSFGSGGYDMFVVRTDKDGTLIWQKSFGGLDWDFGYAVRTTPGSDSLIIAGSTYSFGYGKQDGYIVKTDLNGNFQWQKTYGGAEDDEFKSFVLTYNNQYAFAGTTKSQGDVKGDCWIQKTGLGGDSVRSIKYGNSNTQFLNDIKEHPVSKNFYMCGGWDKLGLDSTSALLLCLDENGVFQFEDIFSYRIQKDEQYYSLAHYKNNVYFYLRKATNSSFDKKQEGMMFLYNDNSYMVGTKYGSLEDDELYAVAPTKNKGFVCVGYTKGFGSNLSDVFLVKVDSTSIIGSPSIIGINEPSELKNNFSVFPTLAKDEITIEAAGNKEELRIYITDCLGHLISSSKTKEELTTLNISDFAEGIYFITVSENYISKTFKIIKSN